MELKKFEELSEYATFDKVKDLGGLFLMVGLGYLLTIILFMA